VLKDVETVVVEELAKVEKVLNEEKKE